jgi:hypothetical protein
MKSINHKVTQREIQSNTKEEIDLTFVILSASFVYLCGKRKLNAFI